MRCLIVPTDRARFARILQREREREGGSHLEFNLLIKITSYAHFRLEFIDYLFKLMKMCLRKLWLIYVNENKHIFLNFILTSLSHNCQRKKPWNEFRAKSIFISPTRRCQSWQVALSQQGNQIREAETAEAAVAAAVETVRQMDSQTERREKA